MYVVVLLVLVQLYVDGVSDRAILPVSVMGNEVPHALPSLRLVSLQLRMDRHAPLDRRKTSSHQVAESQPGWGRNRLK